MHIVCRACRRGRDARWGDVRTWLARARSVSGSSAFADGSCCRGPSRWVRSADLDQCPAPSHLQCLACRVLPSLGSHRINLTTPESCGVTVPACAVRWQACDHPAAGRLVQECCLHVECSRATTIRISQLDRHGRGNRQHQQRVSLVLLSSTDTRRSDSLSRWTRYALSASVLCMAPCSHGLQEFIHHHQ